MIDILVFSFLPPSPHKHRGIDMTPVCPTLTTYTTQKGVDTTLSSHPPLDTTHREQTRRLYINIFVIVFPSPQTYWRVGGPLSVMFDGLSISNIIGVYKYREQLS